MVKIKEWFDKNKLCLNWEKTKYMIFGNRKKNENVIVIEGTDIERVNEIKFLGVIYLELNSGLLKFKDLVDLKILICMWKAKQRVLPMDLQNVMYSLSYQWRIAIECNIISKLFLHVLHKNRFDLFVYLRS